VRTAHYENKDFINHELPALKKALSIDENQASFTGYTFTKCKFTSQQLNQVAQWTDNDHHFLKLNQCSVIPTVFVDAQVVKKLKLEALPPHRQEIDFRKVTEYDQDLNETLIKNQYHGSVFISQSSTFKQGYLYSQLEKHNELMERVAHPSGAS
jgi:hypothetical protein